MKSQSEFCRKLWVLPSQLATVRSKPLAHHPHTACHSTILTFDYPLAMISLASPTFPKGTTGHKGLSGINQRRQPVAMSFAPLQRSKTPRSSLGLAPHLHLSYNKRGPHTSKWSILIHCSNWAKPLVSCMRVSLCACVGVRACNAHAHLCVGVCVCVCLYVCITCVCVCVRSIVTCPAICDVQWD